MKILFAFWIFSCLILSIIGFKLQLGKPGQPFERFDGTCGLRNLSIVAHYYNLKIEGTTFMANASIEVKEDIMTDPTFQFKFVKCKNADNLDTCEQAPEMHFKRTCSTIFYPNNPLWGPTFTGFEPRLECPLKKNVYRSTNAPMDMKLFFMLPRQPEYWKVRIEVKHNETGRIIGCCLIDTHVSMKW